MKIRIKDLSLNEPMNASPMGAIKGGFGIPAVLNNLNSVRLSAPPKPAPTPVPGVPGIGSGSGGGGYDNWLNGPYGYDGIQEF